MLPYKFLKLLCLILLFGSGLFGCDVSFSPSTFNSEKPYTKRQDEPERIALVKAVQEGRLEHLKGTPNLTRWLTTSDSHGKYLFHYAAEYGHAALVDYFIAQTAHVGIKVSAGNINDGCNVWHYAALGGHSHIIELLHRRGIAGYDVRSQEGNTFTHLAAKNGHIAVFDTLADLGGYNAVLLLPNDTQRTTVDAVIASRDLNLINAMHRMQKVDLPHDDTFVSYKSLHPTCVAPTSKCVDRYTPPQDIFYLYGPQYRNRKHDRGWNQLMYAVYQGDIKHVENLLSLPDTVVDARNDYGLTPLMIATYQGHTDIVRALLKHHANPDITDFWRRTALTYAVICNEEAIAELLIEAHQRTPNEHATNHSGETPLAEKQCLSDFSLKEYQAIFRPSFSDQLSAVTSGEGKFKNSQDLRRFLLYKALSEGDTLVIESFVRLFQEHKIDFISLIRNDADLERAVLTCFIYGHQRACHLLFEQGFNQLLASTKHSVLMYAIFNQDYKTIKTLVKRWDPSWINDKDASGYQAIYYARILGDKKALSCLQPVVGVTAPIRLDDAALQAWVLKCIEEDDRILLQALLKAYAKEPVLSAHFESFLMHAVENEREFIVRDLAHYSVNHLGQERILPKGSLYATVPGFDEDLIEFLLQRFITDEKRKRLLSEFLHLNQIKTVVLNEKHFPDTRVLDADITISLSHYADEKYRFLSKAPDKDKDKDKRTVGYTFRNRNYVVIDDNSKYGFLHQLGFCEFLGLPFQGKACVDIMKKRYFASDLVFSTGGSDGSMSSNTQMLASIFCDVFHEWMHHMDFKGGEPDVPRDFPRLTEYSKVNDSEYKAEHGVVWLLDYKSFKKLDPEAAVYFDRLMETALRNSKMRAFSRRN